MVQATTPTFILTLPNDVDLSIANNIYFTLRQGAIVVNKEDEDMTIEGQNVSVYLTQAETLQFKPSTPAYLQLNWTYANGSRACTVIKSVDVGNNLLKEVVE